MAHDPGEACTASVERRELGISKGVRGAMERQKQAQGVSTREECPGLEVEQRGAAEDHQGDDEVGDVSRTRDRGNESDPDQNRESERRKELARVVFGESWDAGHTGE